MSGSAKLDGPIKLSDWSLDRCEEMIEQWRNLPSGGERDSDYAGKAGAMWAAAFVLMQHARALQAEHTNTRT